MLLLLPGGAAQPGGDLVVGSARFAGEQQWSGELLGLRLRSVDAPGRATLAISAPFLHLDTFNSTAPAVAYVALRAQDGGVSRDYGPATVASDPPKPGLDVLVVPVAGAARPTLTAASSSLATAKSADDVLQEPPYARGNRPLLSSDIGSAVEATAASHRVRVEGTFAVSVFAMNLTVGDDPVATGSMRSRLHPDAGTGAEVAAETVDQVAQILVRDGWLELESDEPALAYVDDLLVRGDGLAELAGVTGPLSDGKAAAGSRLVVDGLFELRQAWTGGRLYTRFESVQGDVTLDGQPARPLVGAAGDARPGNVAVDPAADGALPLGLAGSLVALMAAAVVVHGPVQSFRFRSLQRRFERRDYLAVLARIDAFTRRRRFRRSANLLKAISLLSLGEFREASLFLGTLRPADGPDPATQAFLRACAAAGQGQDADALAHLGDCFRLDPTFREEARTVPALRGLLPYFELDAGGAGA